MHRKLKEKAFYNKDSEKVHLWIHLLLKANHAGYEEMLGGKPYFCKCGQFTTGRKQLSIETGISESKIERILTYFEKIEQQIEQQKTNTNRLISILNWNQYQQGEQQIEQQVNNDRTTSEQQVNTLQEGKEWKECNNGKKKIVPQAQIFDEKLQVNFDELNNSDIYLEGIAMKTKLTIAITKNYLRDFFFELQTKQDIDRSLQSIKNYFYNWIKKKVKVTEKPLFDPKRQYIDENGKIQTKLAR